MRSDFQLAKAVAAHSPKSLADIGGLWITESLGMAKDTSFPLVFPLPAARSPSPPLFLHARAHPPLDTPGCPPGPYFSFKVDESDSNEAAEGLLTGGEGEDEQWSVFFMCEAREVVAVVEEGKKLRAANVMAFTATLRRALRSFLSRVLSCSSPTEAAPTTMKSIKDLIGGIGSTPGVGGGVGRAPLASRVTSKGSVVGAFSRGPGSSPAFSTGRRVGPAPRRPGTHYSSLSTGRGGMGGPSFPGGRGYRGARGAGGIPNSFRVGAGDAGGDFGFRTSGAGSIGGLPSRPGFSGSLMGPGAFRGGGIGSQGPQGGFGGSVGVRYDPMFPGDGRSGGGGVGGLGGEHFGSRDPDNDASFPMYSSGPAPASPGIPSASGTLQGVPGVSMEAVGMVFDPLEAVVGPAVALDAAAHREADGKKKSQENTSPSPK